MTCWKTHTWKGNPNLDWNHNCRCQIFVLVSVHKAVCLPLVWNFRAILHTKGNWWNVKFDCNVKLPANLCGCLKCFFCGYSFLVDIFSCLDYVITVVALVAHQEINNVRGITVIVYWTKNMACPSYFDVRVCSDDVADLAFRFFTLFINSWCYSIWKFLFY